MGDRDFRVGPRKTFHPAESNPPTLHPAKELQACVSHITLFAPISYGNLGNVWAFADQRGGDLLMIRRREFIARLGAAGAYAAVPRLAFAKQDTRVRRLASLLAGDENHNTTAAGAMFLNELARLGWVEGRNLQVDRRYGGGDPDRRRRNAAELVSLAPDVIVVNGAPVIVQQQTQTIPIVLAGGGDVFVSGLVKNLAHPEGNITGVTGFFSSISGKQIELLKEAVPRVERVAFIYNPELSQLSNGDPRPIRMTTNRREHSLSGGSLPDEVEGTSRALAVRTTGIPFRDAGDLVRSIDAFATEPDGGLVIAASVSSNHWAMISTLAIQYRLPTIYTLRAGIEGGLIFYGARGTDIVVRAASLVDRILRGAKPGDLPVEFPTRFELVVNHKTAKAIGVTIPRAFLVRADEVIELDGGSSSRGSEALRRGR
jgi:putative ABC transport system substrate-binding protein